MGGPDGSASRTNTYLVRLWDHPWANLLVSLAMGVFFIGGGAYFWALQARLEEERQRHIHERMTGVKMPAPDQERTDRAWNENLRAGALVGGAIWVMGNVFVWYTAWRGRSRPQGQSGPPAG
jgi:hypothetical protein